MGKSSRNFALGAVVAGVAGYLAGILTAPKSGKATREDIVHATAKARVEAERQLKRIYGELNTAIGDAKVLAATTSAKGKKEIDQLINQAVIAKDKAKEVLSAVHEGHAEDKDLDKALAEVKSALKHLTDFIKKDSAA